jgi:hypothetical protein
MLHRKSLLLLSFAVFVGVMIGFGIFSSLAPTENAWPTDPKSLNSNIVDLPVVPLEEAFPHVIPPRSSLFLVLRDLDVDPATIHAIVQASKPVHDLSRVHPGIRFQLSFDPLSGTQLTQIQFRLSALEKLNIKRQHTDWVAEKIVEQVDLKVVHFSGAVTSSLWESAVKAGMGS